MHATTAANNAAKGVGSLPSRAPDVVDPVEDGTVAEETIVAEDAAVAAPVLPQTKHRVSAGITSVRKPRRT